MACNFGKESKIVKVDCMACNFGKESKIVKVDCMACNFGKESKIVNVDCMACNFGKESKIVNVDCMACNFGKEFGRKLCSPEFNKRVRVIIMKTSPCIEDPLTPHFYIVKLGFTGVYIFFYLFLLQNIDCGCSLEPPH